MARGLGLGHREFHVCKQPARPALLDVPFGLLVRSRRRGADRVQAELLTELLQLCRGHGLIVP